MCATNTSGVAAGTTFEQKFSSLAETSGEDQRTQVHADVFTDLCFQTVVVGLQPGCREPTRVSGVLTFTSQRLRSSCKTD